MIKSDFYSKTKLKKYNFLVSWLCIILLRIWSIAILEGKYRRLKILTHNCECISQNKIITKVMNRRRIISIVGFSGVKVNIVWKTWLNAKFELKKVDTNSHQEFKLDCCLKLLITFQITNVFWFLSGQA